MPAEAPRWALIIAAISLAGWYGIGSAVMWITH